MGISYVARAWVVNRRPTDRKRTVHPFAGNGPKIDGSPQEHRHDATPHRSRNHPGHVIRPSGDLDPIQHLRGNDAGLHDQDQDTRTRRRACLTR